MNIRFIAAKTLTPVLQRKASLSADFERNIADIPQKDRALFQELCFGTLRHYFELEQVSQTLLSKKLKNKDADVYGCVLIGLYQLRHLRIPDHAAISETVDAVKKLKKLWAVKLVNAVLRNYLRQQDSINEQLKNKQDFSHPEWLLQEIKQAWPETWQAVLEANNQPAPLTLRVNNQKLTRDEYLKQLEMEAEPTEFAHAGIRLQERLDITQLPGYADGSFSVQDEAAQLSAQLLDLRADHKVLDACCAPGGKTCHILEAEPALKEVVAVELEASRMQRVEENLARLGLNATLKVANALETDTWWDGEQFDRILLDAPCSATGVIRRHPDIKLLRRHEDLANLSQLQGELLDKMWELLKPGGILVYATCSILPKENTQVAEAFLAHNKDAEQLEIKADWGIEQTVGRQLLPQTGGHDGFYYARFRKKS